ncbi:MAG: hypothetical protein J1E83_01735 [Lachnospiraceae bacterium]|nr:hypothetical protein [Lachnospiraceae bacterium]
MKKSIGVILCICLLANVLSGCEAKAGTGAASNNLTEKDKAATVEENSEPETDDTAGSGNDQTPVTEESAGEMISPREEPGWKQAYIAKAEEIEEEYGFSMEYDLIYIDGDNIPELVAGPTGYWFILYTWKDGEVYELIDYAPYGTHGRIYCFEPYQGIIEESVYDMITTREESDSYTVFYTGYHTVTEDMEIMEQYELIEEWRETGSTYFYRDAPWLETEPREIEEEEFFSYKKENLPEIVGRFDLDALRFLLGNADDSFTFFSDSGNMADEAVSSLLVTETYYDGEGAVTSQDQIKYEYDADGNQIRVLSYDEVGTYYEYKYDDSGNLSEEVSYENGVMFRHVKYEYDEDGHRIKSQIIYNDDRFKMLTVYEYHYYGNLIRKTTYYYSGRKISKISDEYEYDWGSNLMIRKAFCREDILDGTEEYAYDSSGNLIKEESYDAEGNAFWFIRYDYDKNGNMIEETTLSYIQKYEYDEQNNKTKEIYYLMDGSIDHYIEWTYEWQ